MASFKTVLIRCIAILIAVFLPLMMNVLVGFWPALVMIIVVAPALGFIAALQPAGPSGPYDELSEPDAAPAETQLDTVSAGPRN